MRSKIDGGLKTEFRRHLTTIHWQPIETGMIASGVPDLNYCENGNEGWVETKKTDGWAVGLRDMQCAWIMRRSRAGGRVFIAVRRMTKRDDELWLFPGSMVRELKTEGLRPWDPALYRLGAGKPADWDWERVRSLLSGGKHALTPLIRA